MYTRRWFDGTQASAVTRWRRHACSAPLRPPIGGHDGENPVTRFLLVAAASTGVIPSGRPKARRDKGSRPPILPQARACNAHTRIERHRARITAVAMNKGRAGANWRIRSGGDGTGFAGKQSSGDTWRPTRNADEAFLRDTCRKLSSYKNSQRSNFSRINLARRDHV